jgi:hypothetical protein
MKKLINCLALCVILFSCKKEINSNPGVIEGPKFEVVFNLADFPSKVSSLPKGKEIKDAPLSEHADFLTYIAYNSDGIEVSRIKQDLASGNATRINNPAIFPDREVEEFAGPQTFGCIKDSLASGEYTVVIIASKKEFSINNRNNEVLEYGFLPLAEATFYYNRGLDSWSRAEDTFFKKFTITVSDDDSQQNVVLDRIVGKAEIKILDSRPGTTYKFLFVNENEAFRFSTELPFGGTDDVFMETSLPTITGTANLLYSKFLINTQTPVDVIINVYESGALSATKTVEDVRFYKNKRTILTGNIYSNGTMTGFSVTVNDEFDADSVEVTF